MKYLLDTNICIYLINEKHESVLAKFKTLKVGDVGLSSITFAELMYGVHNSRHQVKNHEALQEFTLMLEIASFDEEAAVHYGDIRAYLEKKGIPIGALDLMIAAHARSMGVTLVTNNKKEFARVPELSLENWVRNH
jgi:tRNA(fMet)-specific endonuclease VapC